MKKTSIIVGMIFAASLAGVPGNASPKLEVLLNEIVPSNSASMSRGQLFVKGLPADIEGYHMTEIANDGSYTYNKTRVQKFVTKTPLKLGLVTQHINFSGDSYEQIGIASRLEGAPTSNTFARVDLRYFLQRNHWNSYVFFDSKHFFADVETNYKNATLKINPGIDYKVSKNLLVGIEYLFSGRSNNLKTDYTALRIGVTF